VQEQSNGNGDGGREGDLKGALGGFACGLVWEVVSSNQTLELFGRLGFRISMRTGLTAKYGCRVADILHWCKCSYLEYLALLLLLEAWHKHVSVNKWRKDEEM